MVIAGRDSERVERTRREIGAALGVVCDLAEPAAPDELIAEATAKLGAIDVLVNNVGVAYQVPLEEVTDQQWDEMWQLNVMSYVRAIRAVLPGMRERRRGVIVNLSSTAGKRPSTGMPNYSVTKAAVLSLSRLVADLYARRWDPVQRCRAWADGDRRLARRGRARRPAGRALGEDTQRGARGRRQGPPAGTTCRAGGDRGCGGVPLFGPIFVRDGRRVERRRRHRPDHHLSSAVRTDRCKLGALNSHRGGMDGGSVTFPRQPREGGGLGWDRRPPRRSPAAG